MTQYSNQEKILEITGLITKSLYPQPFIFGGTKGIGKATAAKEVVRQLLPNNNDMLHNSFWLESGGEIVTVEQVRQIKTFLSHTLNNESFRVVVIDSVDELSNNSANALLKILEDIPKQSALILISHQPNDLIDTIKSRCVLIKFKVPQNAYHIVQQGHGFEDKEAKMLLRLSHDIPGVAILLGKNQGLEVYKGMVSVLSNYETAYNESYCWVESYFTDNESEKWWLFGYLIKYLLEKIIKTFYLGHQGSHLFEGEKLLIERFGKYKSMRVWMKTYDEIVQLIENTKKLYLDYKNVAVVIIQLMNRAK